MRGAKRISFLILGSGFPKGVVCIILGFSGRGHVCFNSYFQALFQLQKF